MASRAASLQDFDKLLHLIYLANEILFKAMQQQQGTAKQEEGQPHLDPAAAAAVTAACVPAAGAIMAAAFAAAQVRLMACARQRLRLPAVLKAAAGWLGSTCMLPLFGCSTYVMACTHLVQSLGSVANLTTNPPLRCLCCLQAAGNTEGSGKLDKMLSFWRDKGVFDSATIARLQHEMRSSNASALLLTNYPPAAPAAAPGQPSGWGPAAGTPTQPPQGPVSGGWGAPPPGVPSPHMPAGSQPAAGGWGPPPTAFQPAQPYPQQPPAAGGWGPVPPAGPWGAPAVPPAYPGAAAQPPYNAPSRQYPGAVPPGVPQPFPGAVPPAVPLPGAVPSMGVPPVVPDAGPQPVSSLAFPPGLLPQLCREKSKYSEPYAAIEPAEIDKAGLPPPPEKDAYLKSRLDKFMVEVSTSSLRRERVSYACFARGITVMQAGTATLQSIRACLPACSAGRFVFPDIQQSDPVVCCCCCSCYFACCCCCCCHAVE